MTAYVDARPKGRVATAQIEQPKTSRLPFPVRLYVMMTVLPILFNVGSLALSGQRVVLLALVIPLTFKLLRGAYGRLIWTDIFFFLHILWATLAIAVNNPDRVLQNAGSTGVEFMGGYLVGRAYIRSTDDFLALIRFLTVLVFCSLPFALFEAKTGRPVLIELIHKLPGFTSVPILNIEARMGLERAQVVFAHPIHYGLFCGVAFSLVFVGLKGLISTTRRYLTAILIGFCVFLSLSSGALLPLILQIFFILWAYMLGSIRQRWLVLVGLFILAYIGISLLSNRPPIRVFMTYATFSAHNAYWRGIIFEWGMINIWKSPIFGIGMNDWVRPFFMRSSSIDNFWLLSAVRAGFPGLGLLLLGFLPGLWWVGRRKFDEGSRLWLLRRAWIFTFAGLTLTLCTVAVWTAIYSFVFFLFGAGMWFLTAEALSGQQSADQTQVNAGARPTKSSLNRAPVDMVQPSNIGLATSAQKGQIYSRFTTRKNKS